ncbi:MAG: ROK family protein [Candidatus Odinarchaeia archaeon]
MIGIDVGGNTIIAVKVENTEITWMKKFLIHERSRKEFFKILNLIIEEADDRKIGIGIPGVFKDDYIIKCPNFPNLNNLRLSEELSGFHLKVENDANCFAYGEYFNHKTDLVGLTIGTGIGGGIIINGRIYHGKGDAGEFGHITVVANGRICSCGGRGCLEEYISDKAFKKDSKMIFGRELNPSELHQLALKGNEKAINIFKKGGKYLGIAFSIIANILNPPIIVLGGGVSKASEFFLNTTIREMEKRIFVSKPKVIIGNEISGAYGAAMLWV